MEPRLKVSSLLIRPVFSVSVKRPYHFSCTKGHILKSQLHLTFTSQEIWPYPPLIRPPVKIRSNVHGPLVTVSTGFHYISHQFNLIPRPGKRPWERGCHQLDFSRAWTSFAALTTGTPTPLTLPCCYHFHVFLRVYLLSFTILHVEDW